MSRTKLSQNSIAAGAINANTMFAADVVSPHAVANTSTYSVAELLVGGKILLDNTGKVGIGITAPLADLHIRHDSGSTNQLLLTYSTTDHLGFIAGGSGCGLTVTSDNFFTINHQPAADRGGESNLTERLRIDTAGKVGIGTTAPDGLLHVHTASAGSVSAEANADDLVVENSAHGGISILTPDNKYGNLWFGSASDSAGFLVDWYHDGNTGRVHTSKVGGTIQLRADNSIENMTLAGASGAQYAQFHGRIYGNSDGNTIGNGASTNLAISLVVKPANNSLNGIDVYAGANNSQFPLRVSNYAGTSLFRVGGDGQVGIGTTSPGARLDSRHDQAALSYLFDTNNVTHGGSSVWRMITRNLANDGTASVDFYKPTGGGFELRNNDTHANNNTNFYVGSSERVRITSAGRLGIGTTSPTAPLDVRGYVSDVGIIYGNAGAASQYLMTLTDGVATNFSIVTAGAVLTLGSDAGSTQTALKSTGHERMRLDASGNVGIGTTSPNNILDLESTSPELHINDSDATLGGTINSRVIFQANGSEHGWVGLSSSAGTMGLINNQGDLWISADPNNAVSGTAIKFVVDATEKAYINSQGFGVGAVPNTTFGPLLYAQGTPSANKPIIAAYSTGNSNNAGIGILNDSGNRGIWTTGSVMKFTRTYEGNSTADLVIGAAGQVGIAGENYGTDGQVLTSQGASAAPAWEDAGGGAWTFISSVTASNSASVDFTSGIDSTYDQYVIIMTDIVPDTDNVDFSIRTGDSGGFDSGGSDYAQYLTRLVSSQASVPNGANASNNSRIQGPSGNGSAAGEGMSGEIWFGDPAGTALNKIIRINWTMIDNAGDVVTCVGGAVRKSTGAIDRIQFYFSSGNVESGTFRLYGIANS